MEVPTLYFIGDSLIERWDLQASFSSFITYNEGVGGSGVKYIEEKRGLMKGKTVVVLTGCNDHGSMTEKNLDNYVERYFVAITGMEADRVYLIQVLPRFYSKDSPGANERIMNFNQRVVKKVSAYPDIVYVPTFDRFYKDGKQLEGYFIDGVHLNEPGYELLSEILYSYLN